MIFLAIHSPSPDPPENKVFSVKGSADKNLSSVRTSILQLVLVKLRELRKYPALILGSDAGAGVNHLHPIQTDEVVRRLQVGRISKTR